MSGREVTESILRVGYDSDLRRDTPLAVVLKARIREHGPLPVSAYMDACLNDPEHGYYRLSAAIGRAGDFITAPEISQTFGELIGLWCAVVWQQMGAPASFRLVELGPGRGVLMADALRAARLVPGFVKAANVVLVETNSTLREMQEKALANVDASIHWSVTPDAITSGITPASSEPAILIANEFLDTLPVDQFKRLAGGWQERRVGIDSEERLVFADQHAPAAQYDVISQALDARFPGACEGELVTVADYGGVIGRWLLPAATSSGDRPGVAALLVDYGAYAEGTGDTLQAVRRHSYEHPLTSPGEADLSALVDFRELARHATASGLSVDGPVTQATLLGNLGIVERASRLMGANPGNAADIEAAVARLISPNAMGGRFKAIGIRSRGVPPLPGLT